MNITLLVAEICRRLPDLAKDPVNAETVLSGMIAEHCKPQFDFTYAAMMFGRLGFKVSNRTTHKTLRDEFAMAALTGICAATRHDDAPSIEQISGWSYQQADAMLEQRKLSEQ